MKTLIYRRIPIWLCLGLLFLSGASCNWLLKPSWLAKMDAQEKTPTKDALLETKQPERKRSVIETAKRDSSDLGRAHKKSISLSRPERNAWSRSMKALEGGKKTEVRRASVVKARELESVERVKICHVTDLDVWRVTFYVKHRSKIDLKQFVWDADEGKLAPLLVLKQIPVERLDSHVKSMRAGRACEILTQRGKVSGATNWTRVYVEKLVGGGRTKKMGRLDVPSVRPR